MDRPEGDLRTPPQRQLGQKYCCLMVLEGLSWVLSLVVVVGVVALVHLAYRCIPVHSRHITKRSVVNSPDGCKCDELGAINLVGRSPLQSIKSHGTIGPWTVEGGSEREWAYLDSAGYELIIQNPGQYLISVQVFYLSGNVANSYEVVRRDADGQTEVLSVCVQRSSALSSEVMCLTSVVAHLRSNDRLRVSQTERERVVIFTRSHTHWAVIRLQAEI